MGKAGDGSRTRKRKQVSNAANDMVEATITSLVLKKFKLRNEGLNLEYKLNPLVRSSESYVPLTQNKSMATNGQTDRDP